MADDWEAKAQVEWLQGIRHKLATAANNGQHLSERLMGLHQIFTGILWMLDNCQSVVDERTSMGRILCEFDETTDLFNNRPFHRSIDDDYKRQHDHNAELLRHPFQKSKVRNDRTAVYRALECLLSGTKVWHDVKTTLEDVSEHRSKDGRVVSKHLLQQQQVDPHIWRTLVRGSNGTYSHITSDSNGQNNDFLLVLGKSRHLYFPLAMRPFSYCLYYNSHTHCCRSLS